MAHELDLSTGTAAMAYVAGSATPWHHLGQTVNPDATPEEWAVAGKLNWSAMRATVLYVEADDALCTPRSFSDKHVIYRSDTHAPLSVVSKDYREVQPYQVLDFFGQIAEKGDFQIETVGALKGGRRIWALARVGENARIMDDLVAPYLLLATSYDASMATIAQFTTIRVVCQNTLNASLQNQNSKRRVTIPHSAMFNPDEVRADLGIARNSWDEFILKAGAMAQRKINDAEMDAYLQELLEPFIPYGSTYTPDKVKASKGYQRIERLFKGEQLGTGQDAINGTLWGLLQACTQYIDHEKGRIDDNRLDGAWFGPGAKIKDRAYALAEAVVI